MSGDPFVRVLRRETQRGAFDSAEHAAALVVCLIGGGIVLVSLIRAKDDFDEIDAETAYGKSEGYEEIEVDP